MAWKDWPYWSQGLIWGIIIALIIDAIIGLSVFLPGDWAFGYQFLWIPILTPILIVAGLIIGIIIGIAKKK